jgi:dethiobiotin synthetase
MVPLNDQDLIIDLVERWHIPIILVCNIYLGSINHSLLSIAYLKSRNVKVAGIIFNGPETPSTESVITSYSPWPVLMRVRPAEKVTSSWIEKHAQELRHELR